MKDKNISEKVSRTVLILSVISFSVLFILLVSEIYFSKKKPDLELIYLWMTINVINALFGILVLGAGLLSTYNAKKSGDFQGTIAFNSIASIILGSMTFMLQGIIIISGLFIFII